MQFHPTTPQRFWAKVDKNGPIPGYAPHLGACWLWVAGKMGHGYGLFCYEALQVYVHRFVYELCVGPIPDGLTIDHLCRVRHCVRPTHLEVVTCGENVLRGEGVAAKNARRTACPNGHPFQRNGQGLRWCPICRRPKDAAWARARRARRKAGIAV